MLPTSSVHKDGKPYVYEAISKVSLTPMRNWIHRGENKDYTIMRLKQNLSEEQLQKMKKVGERYDGKSYNLLFEWSDDRMYCSEIVWKIYKEGAGITLSKPKKMKNYHFDHPAVQKKLNERWKGNINWNEKIVAPSDLMESNKLMLVETTYKDKTISQQNIDLVYTSEIYLIVLQACQTDVLLSKRE